MENNRNRKNDRVCRKYVIESMEDLKRVPALNNNFMENKEELFDFEKEFKIAYLLIQLQ